MSYTEQVRHAPTHDRASRMRREFNQITDSMSAAKSALSHADTLMTAAKHIADISEKLEIESLDPEAFIRNIHLYVDDFLNKLEIHIKELAKEDAI